MARTTSYNFQTLVFALLRRRAAVGLLRDAGQALPEVIRHIGDLRREVEKEIIDRARKRTPLDGV